MRSLGANLEIIKSSDGKINKELITKMIKKADQISKEPNTFFTNQLNNTDVIEGFIPLGEEILNQLDGNVDAVCDTVGTAGTLMGIAKALKKLSQIVKLLQLSHLVRRFYRKELKALIMLKALV